MMSEKIYGFMRKMLKIDVTNKTWSIEIINKEDYKKYLGGNVLSTKIFYDIVKNGINAFDDDNALIVATGPLTLTGVPSSSRFSITSLSPNNNKVVSSNCGGDFGIHLKKAGYDVLVIIGKANDKLWIDINEENISFNEVNLLSGVKISDTRNHVRNIVGDCGDITIGVAGENLVKYSAILSGDRAAGSGGLGAVLGAKNIKIITTRGNRKPSIFNKEKLIEKNKDVRQKIMIHPWISKNSNDNFFSEHAITKTGCKFCPVQCGRVLKIDGIDIRGSELKTLVKIPVDFNIEDLTVLSNRINELGLDVSKLSKVIEYVYYNKEYRQLHDIGDFNSLTMIMTYIDKIAYRIDVGDELAEGDKYLVNKYGIMEKANIDNNKVKLKMLIDYLNIKPDGWKHFSKSSSLLIAFIEAVSASGMCVFSVFPFLPKSFNNLNDYELKEILVSTPFLDLIYNATGIRLSIDEFIEVGKRVK